MKNWSVLCSLFLILTLTACACDPVIVTETEIVEVDKLIRVEVPGALLIPCEVTPLPRIGDSWDDVFQIMKAKDLEQKACNERFAMITNWMSDP